MITEVGATSPAPRWPHRFLGNKRGLQRGTVHGKRAKNAHNSQLSYEVSTFQAYIRVDGRRIGLGTFNTPEEESLPSRGSTRLRQFCPRRIIAQTFLSSVIDLRQSDLNAALRPVCMRFGAFVFGGHQKIYQPILSSVINLHPIAH